MCELICFIVGCIAGWFSHSYKEKLLKVRDTIKDEFLK